MTLSEQALRAHLEAEASDALPPRFSTPDLAGRIRRRRATAAGAVAGCVAVAAALAIAVPLSLSSGADHGLPGSPGNSRVLGPPFAIRNLGYVVAMNGRRPALLPHPKPPEGCGRTTADPCPGRPGAGFVVSPGERLSFRLTVTIPSRARLTDLWFGISGGTFGSDADGRPTGQNPILAHFRSNLQPGRHVIDLDWTVPDQTPSGTKLWLAASWTGMMPVPRPGRRLVYGSATGPVTELLVSSAR